MSTVSDKRSPRASTNRSTKHGAGPNASRNTDLAELVAAALDGDAESWVEITQRFTNLLWAVARSYRLCSDDAADVVQNTWLRLLENLDRIEQPDALPGWLATTARRESLSLLRSRARQIPMDDDYFHTADDDSPGVDTNLLIEEQDAQLWACFVRLPARDQQLLRALTACDRPSYTAIAAAFEMPVGSIGPTRMRALKRLRALLDGTQYVFGDIDTMAT